MLMSDAFDKFMHVVPVKGEKEEALASGMTDCVNKMEKKLYTDDAGAMNKEAIHKYLREENIEHHRTRAYPNFSERAIRAFKICCIGELKRMRKKENKTSNGNITNL